MTTVPSQGEAEGPPTGLPLSMFAARVAVATLVVLGILVVAIALWSARLVLALLFAAIILASAIRPGVEWLGERRVPRGIAVLVHYALLLGIVAVALWLVVPAATDQVQVALGDQQLQQQARESTGIKHDILIALDKRLNDIPSGAASSTPHSSTGGRPSR